MQHYRKLGYETVECQVRVNKSMDWSFRNATHVNSYWGYDQGIENVAQRTNVWENSGEGLFDTQYKNRYPQRHTDNGW